MSYTPPSYPNSIPSVDDVFGFVNDKDWIEVESWDAIRKELVACLTTLGTNPEGDSATVDARIQALEDAPAGEPDKIHDDDEDTIVSTEESEDEDHVRMDVAGVEAFDLDSDGILTLDKNSGARAYPGGTTVDISTATLTKIELATETYDIQGEFDSSTNYRFTATVAGYYLAIGALRYHQMIDEKSYTIRLYVNGSLVSIGDLVAANGGGQGVYISDIVYLAVNDYVELYTWHNAGVTRSMRKESYYTYLSIAKIR